MKVLRVVFVSTGHGIYRFDQALLLFRLQISVLNSYLREYSFLVFLHSAQIGEVESVLGCISLQYMNGDKIDYYLIFRPSHKTVEAGKWCGLVVVATIVPGVLEHWSNDALQHFFAQCFEFSSVVINELGISSSSMITEFWGIYLECIPHLFRLFTYEDLKRRRQFTDLHFIINPA